MAELGEITQMQHRSMTELRKKLEGRAMDEEEHVAQNLMFEAMGGADLCCLRFLRAADFNVEKAMQAIIDNVKWRREASVHTALVDKLELFRETLPFWSGGFHKPTKEGCPTVIMRVGKADPAKLLEKFNEETLTNFYIFWMEFSLKLQRESIPKKVEKFEKEGLPVTHGVVEIYDLAGVSLSQLNVWALNSLSRVLKIGAEHYPENLHRGFFVNAPVLFSAAWKAVRIVLPAATQNRISVSSGPCTEELLKYIDAKDLPDFLGGTDTSFPYTVPQ